MVAGPCSHRACKTVNSASVTFCGFWPIGTASCKTACLGEMIRQPVLHVKRIRDRIFDWMHNAICARSTERRRSLGKSHAATHDRIPAALWGEEIGLIFRVDSVAVYLQFVNRSVNQSLQKLKRRNL